MSWKPGRGFVLLPILFIALALHLPMAVSGTTAAAIGGRVFFDSDGDGVQDADESGLPDVFITLEGRDEGGHLVQRSTLTGQDGSYRFSDLPAGTFVIEETDPAGYLSTTANAISVTISSTQNYSRAHFGDALPITLWGVVFEDLDADGEQGLGEPGLPDVRLDLYADPDGDGQPAPFQTPLRTTYTAADGLYFFRQLLPGPYVLQETDPERFFSITSNRIPLFLRSYEVGNEYSHLFADIRLAGIGCFPLILRSSHFRPAQLGSDSPQSTPSAQRFFRFSPPSPRAQR